MNDRQDFTQGSITKKLISFMLPVLGALILQAMYSAVDLMIVGRFGTTAGISGVATGSNVMNLVTFTTAGLTTAVTILLGRYIGEKSRERLDKLISGAIAFFLILSISLSILLVLLARPLAQLMQAPEEALEFTAQYIRICGAGFVFICFYNFISSIFRGMGDSTMPLLFVGIACVANIIGDLILVAVFHMNAAGAAIATVGAQAISVLLSVIIIRKKSLPFRVRRSELRINGEVSNVIKIGAPLVVQELLTNVTFLALCAFINKLGLDASGGYGVAQKIVSFILLIPSSIMQSMASFVAQNVGAGKEDRAEKGMFTGMIIGAGIGVVIAYVAFFHGDTLSSIFTGDTDVIARSWEYLKGFSPEAVVTSVLFSYMGYFSGHGQSMFVMLQGLAQSVLVRLPMSYLMSIQPEASLTMIGLAAPSATVFGIIICTLYLIKYKKTLKKVDIC